MGTFFSLFLLAVLATVVHVDAAPRVTIRESSLSMSITAHLNSQQLGGHKLADFERARAKKAIQTAITASKKGKATPQNIPVTNALTTYLATVGVGCPATNYSLLVDTGSSNTWVGATTPYVKTKTSIPTADKFNVTYGSGEVLGKEYIDQLTLGPNVIITNQSIGVATSSQGFDGIDGILGIGPKDLTRESLSGTPGASNTEIPTVTDNLFAQGKIPHNSVGISFEPTTSASEINGELTFGGTDSTKYTGEIHYSDITRSHPASLFWGIEQKITYGAETMVLDMTSGIVDTGTTLLLLAHDAFQKYQKLTGGIMDDSTGLLSITSKQLSNLKSLVFNIQDVDYELTANAQIWPRHLNTMINGTKDGIYLVVGDLGDIGGGLGFVNGFVFLERFYSVFDTANRRVGLATTPFTTAITN